MSMIKRLYLKKNAEGNLKGRPFWGVIVEVAKVGKIWEVDCMVDDELREMPEFHTRREALDAIFKIGWEPVRTHNILNPEAGEFTIDRASKGGCCDPATETYHSM